MKQRRSFTLLELMVVIAIIGILAALVATTVIRMIHSGKVATAQNDISMIYGACEEYKLKFGEYPALTTGDLAYIDQSATDPMYLMVKHRVLNIDFSRVIASTQTYDDPFGKPYRVRKANTPPTGKNEKGDTVPVDDMAAIGPDSAGARIYIYSDGDSESSSTSIVKWTYLKGGK